MKKKKGILFDDATTLNGVEVYYWCFTEQMGWHHAKTTFGKWEKFMRKWWKDYEEEPNKTSEQ